MEKITEKRLKYEAKLVKKNMTEDDSQSGDRKINDLKNSS
jgi:hypothetical protein